MKLGIPKEISLGEKRVVLSYLSVGVIVLLLMMILGLLMLLNQANLISINDKFFYKLMTAHGTGMIGISVLAASSIMWFFLRQYVQLHLGIYLSNLVLSLVGVGMILVAIFGFDFAAGWTFLYPLPALSSGMWGKTGAALYLFGLLIIGVGLLIVYFDIAGALILKYRSLGRSLGWNVIFGKAENGPPPTVVASTMVTIVNITSLISGASILTMSLINLFNPQFTINPLLAKNLTYAFGHILANSVIYMAVIAVYEILPRYTNRPWKSNKVFLIAWNMSTIFTISIYTHHLLMDFNMPKWALIMGQVLSHANGIPVLVVTGYGTLMIIYRSGIKWDMASGMMVMAMFGWVSGALPAILDATIKVNYIMHNSKWVPGHFHMYMGIGSTLMIFGFMYYLMKHDGERNDMVTDKISFWVYVVFFYVLSVTFLYSGAIGTPRRWAKHLPEWVGPNIIASFTAVFIIVAVVYFFFRFLHYVFTVGIKMNNEEQMEERQDIHA